MRFKVTLQEKNLRIISVVICIAAIVAFSLLRQHLISQSETKLSETRQSVLRVLALGLNVDFPPYAVVVPVKRNYLPDEGVINDTVLINNETGQETAFTQLKSPYRMPGGPVIVIVRIESAASTVFWLGLGVKVSIFVLLIIASMYLVKRFAKEDPAIEINTLMTALTAFAQDKRNNLKDFKVDEIDKCVEAVSTLKARLRTAPETLEDSISQPLQPVLALIITRSEITLKETDLTDEMKAVLNRLHDLALQLMDINISLSLLSKIDSTEFGTRTDIDLKAFLSEQLRDYKQMAEERSISLEVKPLGECTLNANTDLIEILVSHVMINSLNHNYEGGRIIVEADDYSFRVSNTGMPPKRKTEELLKPFIVEDEQAGNTGLGLSIIGRICSLYNYRLTYRYQDGMHRLEISFK